jgi:hypothetical protein
VSPEKIAFRRTHDGKTLRLWSDGSLTWAFGEYVRGTARPRTTEQSELALRAGWLVLGEVEIVDSDDVPLLVVAARWGVDHDALPGDVRRRFHELKSRGESTVLRPVWTTYETDRDGRPTVQVWKLPRIKWPGLAVWRERGKYTVCQLVGGARDTYNTTGVEFTNLRDLSEFLLSQGVDHVG